MDKIFRIVFQGGLREGLDPALVRQQATARLKANPAQAERIFSGERVLLKQNLDAAQAKAYQSALAQLGMLVTLEEMSPAAPAAALSAPPRIEAPKPAELCQFQRTHINLARAEALLNGTDPTQLAPTIAAPMPVAAQPRRSVPRAAVEPRTPNDDWMHESGFVSLERAQKRLADAAAQFSQPAEMPAHAARQSLPEGAPSTVIIIPPAPATRPAQIFSSQFQCRHCGTEHQIESHLQLNITTMPAGERAVS
ncbi:hypothetical protein GCM10027046_26350 [Uliginosibacterium flavum]|uniref:Uncharacterized protein n=1 Tax=Uliginosibacterium flavum TaxID=1396831 RepID=A0ABV2TL17_9RHOO